MCKTNHPTDKPPAAVIDPPSIAALVCAVMALEQVAVAAIRASRNGRRG
jgi:hypothetical protein